MTVMISGGDHGVPNLISRQKSNCLAVIRILGGGKRAPPELPLHSGKDREPYAFIFNGDQRVAVKMLCCLVGGEILQLIRFVNAEYYT